MDEIREIIRIMEERTPAAFIFQERSVLVKDMPVIICTVIYRMPMRLARNRNVP